jgi:hypothetical protein
MVKRILGRSFVGFFLLLTGMLVVSAGPLTSKPAVGFVDPLGGVLKALFALFISY